MREALETLLGYLAVRDEVRDADLIVALGSNSFGAVAEHAADLYRKGRAPRILFSGGRGRLSPAVPETEAGLMRARAIESGVPDRDILVEEESTNTLENIRLTTDLLRQAGLWPSRVILVTQPALQRRAWATAVRQRPDIEWINSPAPVDLSQPRLIALVLGEIERLPRYAEAGHLEPQSIPADVERACRELRSLGR